MMDVMYAVMMDNGEGPPVGLWRNEEVANRVCAKQPRNHHDVVVPVVPASALDDLTRQLAEACAIAMESHQDAQMWRARLKDAEEALAEARALLAETGPTQ